jgi:hypothetical protein
MTASRPHPAAHPHCGQRGAILAHVLREITRPDDPSGRASFAAWGSIIRLRRPWRLAKRSIGADRATHCTPERLASLYYAPYVMIATMS